MRSIHLVETSVALQSVQSAMLDPLARRFGGGRAGESRWDLSWHADLTEVIPDPSVYTLLVAHEFFDALPFHLLLVRLLFICVCRRALMAAPTS